MPLATGTILNNRYRIVRLLDEGGFGAVYRAWDLNLERPCAVKENNYTSEDARTQFKLEAKMLAELTHPNLPKVSDHFFLAGQGQYLVMDYVEGENLKVMLEKRGWEPFPVTQVLTWINQVCDALIYLHEQDPPIIHRDIKPANIRITPDGRAMLVDFGIAKVFAPGKTTKTGARAYTPGYASPEQEKGEGTDALSDVYSLGATIYSLLTGLEPPPASDMNAGSEPLPAPPEAVNPDVPAHVGRVVMEAMQLNRDQRSPKSIREFKSALDKGYNLQEPPQIALVPKTGAFLPDSSSEIPGRVPRRSACLPWMAGFGLVLSLILIIFVLRPIASGDLQISELSGIASLLRDIFAEGAVSTPTGSSSEAGISSDIRLAQTTTADYLGAHAEVPGMVWISAGVFLMGSEGNSNDQIPVHEVFLDGFYIDEFEVTNAQYAECVSEGACDPPKLSSSRTQSVYYGSLDYLDYPVIHVTWHNAKEYCQWAGKRLPTEAEWEKAARGTDERAYPWGNEFDCSKGNFDDEREIDDYRVPGGEGCDGYVETSPVGSFPAGVSPYGVYDMVGNVWEWVADWYDRDYFLESPKENPVGPVSGESRVVRGGSWSVDLPSSLKVAYRSHYDPDLTVGSIGFRCASSALSPQPSQVEITNISPSLIGTPTLTQDIHPLLYSIRIINRSNADPVVVCKKTSSDQSIDCQSIRKNMWGTRIVEAGSVNLEVSNCGNRDRIFNLSVQSDIVLQVDNSCELIQVSE